MLPGGPKRLPRIPSQWRPVDWVAMTLALALGLAVCLILVATTVQVIIGPSLPQITLSENATQVLIAGTGGLTGLLGAYIGTNRTRRDKRGDRDAGTD